MPEPIYPPQLRNSAQSGVVIVLVIVDERGHVSVAKACSKNPELNKACEEAAYQAVLKPTLLSGRAVKVRGNLLYKYSFKRDTK